MRESPIAAFHEHVEGKRSRGRKQDLDNVRDGQCQGIPEREKHRLDQVWRVDKKQRKESCKSVIVSTLMDERKEEVKDTFEIGIHWLEHKLRNMLICVRARADSALLP